MATIHAQLSTWRASQLFQRISMYTVNKLMWRENLKTCIFLFAVPPVLAPFSFGTISYSDSSLSSVLTLGARTRVLCGLTRGDTPVKFSWLKDGQSIQRHSSISHNQVTISIVDDFSSLLTISSLERGHAGNYTCLASNEAGSDLYTAILDVQGDFRKQYNLFLFVCLNKQTNKRNKPLQMN